MLLLQTEMNAFFEIETATSSLKKQTLQLPCYLVCCSPHCVELVVMEAGIDSPETLTM